MLINNRIKYYRNINKLTQKDLAERIGVRVATISDYETNKVIPNIENLIKITKVFKIKIDDLIEY
ncbi:helix-turn-helix transcriptional regulator [Haploplasma axanthum]|uniref:Antitoxin HipB n=1 Tax=Haploplasma axanthum TaxID=29552 RepID=A0A449BDD4_HAPAX|nr:helix-turn-helix transcriptional regulator [Haploplasma axanthum]VEU80471.1 antitoxin HipB [Haploplasma axanthum]